MLVAATGVAGARDCSVSKEFQLRHPQVLAGVLEDPTGAVLPGIELELRAGKKVVRHLRTDNLGRYDFGEVAAGKYRIRVHYGDNALCAPKVRCGTDKCNLEPRVAVNPKGMVMVD
jgi:Carboxypeptidase regulatory-like domain